MAINKETNAKHGFWEFKKYQEHEWFGFLVKLLIGTVIIYFVSHLVVRQLDRKAGYEYETLGKEELQHIYHIYFERVDTTAALSPGGEQTIDDTTAAVPDAGGIDASNIQPGLSMPQRNDRVIEFVRNHFNYKADSTQLENIREYLQGAAPLEAISFWGSVRLRIRSYFWLVGPEVYFEIIFWTLLGVISSLLFNLGMISRNRTTDPENAQQTTFDSSEIPYQFAKLWYAPIITLVIVLGYNFFQDENIADISSSKGVIVFAFIGGFYSARLVAFLDRLKEVLLPVSTTADLPIQKSPPASLQNITITLDVDKDSIPPEQAAAIAETGLGTATVTLENNETGEITKAGEPAEEQSSSFTVNTIKPGNYTVRAVWSGQVNEQAINLAGEEKTEIKTADTVITVVMKTDPGEE